MYMLLRNNQIVRNSIVTREFRLVFRSRDMAQWIRMFVALLEDLRSISSTWIRHLPTATNPRSKQPILTSEDTALVSIYPHIPMYTINVNGYV